MTTWTYVLAMLLDAAAKGLVILGVAGVGALAMRRASAALRHLVWALALVSLLAVPVLSAALPHLSILPRWIDLEAAVANSDADAESPSSEAANALPLAVENRPDPAASWAVEVTPADSAAAPIPAVADETALTETLSLVRVAPWLMGMWIIGTILCLLPVVVGRLSLWRIGSTARSVTDGPLARLLAEASGQLGMRGRVTLLISERRPMPMIWGVFRSTLLLPVEARTWLPQRQRVVLLHELAHARRADCLTKLATQLACALYWFNPLVWLASRFMQMEAESACDDLVIRAGNRPADYAGHILQIASGLRAGVLTAHSSIAMARKSKLEGRLLGILDGKRNRRKMTVAGVVVAVLLIAGVVLPLSAMEGMRAAKEQVEIPDEVANHLVAKLANGATVELLAASDLHSADKTWWKPDGSAVSKPPCEGMKHPLRKYQYELVIRYKGPSHASDRWSVPGAAAITNTGRPRDKDGKPIEDLRVLGVGFADPAEVSTVIVRYGVATGPWQTLALCSPAGRMSFPRQLDGDRIVISAAESENGTTVIRAATTVIDSATRIVAVKKSGGIQAAFSTTGHGATGIAVRKCKFQLDLKDIDHFEFQFRPYEWVTFRNVSLAPGKKTNVHVEFGATISAGVQPVKPSELRRAYIPDADTKDAQVILDLSSGEMLPVPQGTAGAKAMLEYFTKLGKGDLFFDRKLGVLRGGKIDELVDGEPIPVMPADTRYNARAYDLADLPYKLRVTTGSAKRFDVTVLSVTAGGGINIEYTRAPSPSGSNRFPSSRSGSSCAKKTIPK